MPTRQDEQGLADECRLAIEGGADAGGFLLTGAGTARKMGPHAEDIDAKSSCGRHGRDARVGNTGAGAAGPRQRLGCGARPHPCSRQGRRGAEAILDGDARRYARHQRTAHSDSVPRHLRHAQAGRRRGTGRRIGLRSFRLRVQGHRGYARPLEGRRREVQTWAT